MAALCSHLSRKQTRGIKAKPLTSLEALVCVYVFIPCSFTQPAAVREECVPSHDNACVPGASCQWTHSTFTCQCDKSSSVPMADRSACVVVIKDDFYFRFVTNIDCQVSMFCREYVPLSTLCVEVENDISDGATRTVCVCDRGARVTSDRETCVMRTQATKTGGRHECSDDSDCPSSEDSVSVCVINVQSYSSGEKHTACMVSTEMSQLDFGIVTISRTPRHGGKQSSNATGEQLGNETRGNTTDETPDDNNDAEEKDKLKMLIIYTACGVLGTLLLLCVIICACCEGARKRQSKTPKMAPAKDLDPEMDHQGMGETPSWHKKKQYSKERKIAPEMDPKGMGENPPSPRHKKKQRSKKRKMGPDMDPKGMGENPHRHKKKQRSKRRKMAPEMDQFPNMNNQAPVKKAGGTIKQDNVIKTPPKAGAAKPGPAKPGKPGPAQPGKPGPGPTGPQKAGAAPPAQGRSCMAAWMSCCCTCMKCCCVACAAACCSKPKPPEEPPPPPQEESDDDDDDDSDDDDSDDDDSDDDDEDDEEGDEEGYDNDYY